MISKEEMVREIFKDINLRTVAKDIRIDKVLKNFSYEEIEEVYNLFISDKENAEIYAQALSY